MPSTFRGREILHIGLPETQAVDNSRLFVDNWLSLWRSTNLVEIVQKSIPPYMVMDFALLQDVDEMREPHFLWINLWVSPPDSFHSDMRPGVNRKAGHLG
jgi:hypothetical protein